MLLKATADLGGSKLLLNISLWLMSFVVNKSAAVHARMSLFPVPPYVSWIGCLQAKTPLVTIIIDMLAVPQVAKK